jgi:hypothetical protein
MGKISTAQEHKDTSSWPEGLRQLADVIGPEATLALAEVKGGISIYVPKAPFAGCQLLPIIGEQALAALCKQYGGDWLNVPLGKFIDAYKPRILDLHGRGMSKRQIALKLGCTERYVREVTNAIRGPQQMRLPL